MPDAALSYAAQRAVAAWRESYPQLALQAGGTEELRRLAVAMAALRHELCSTGVDRTRPRSGG